jgi:hypothetical protein
LWEDEVEEEAEAEPRVEGDPADVRNKFYQGEKGTYTRRG